MLSHFISSNRLWNEIFPDSKNIYRGNWALWWSRWRRAQYTNSFEKNGGNIKRALHLNWTTWPASEYFIGFPKKRNCAFIDESIFLSVEKSLPRRLDSKQWIRLISAIIWKAGAISSSVTHTNSIEPRHVLLGPFWWSLNLIGLDRETRITQG